MGRKQARETCGVVVEEHLTDFIRRALDLGVPVDLLQRPDHRVGILRQLHCTRIREELGWRPSVTVDEGLRRTVRWYLDNEDWWQALQDREGVGARLGVKA